MQVLVGSHVHQTGFGVWVMSRYVRGKDVSARVALWRRVEGLLLLLLALATTMSRRRARNAARRQLGARTLCLRLS
jgi:hypothetical protein